MQVGAVLGERFRNEGIAGRGGSGTVYRAIDLLRGNRVAVKMLHGRSAVEEARFGREIVILAQLSHPGIARYIAHGTTPARGRYLVMEWAQGMTLQRRLAHEGLSHEESVRLLIRVSDTLAEAHRCGVVHRDVKPSHIVIPGERGDEFDAAKVLDFGLARRVVEADSPTLNGFAVGTPGYMSTEQARGERVIDARADVFAMGCVLYECLTGRPAFRGSNYRALQLKILFDEPPPIGKLEVDVPVALQSLVERMMAKDSALRPGDADAVSSELRTLSELSPIARPRGDWLPERPTISMSAPPLPPAHGALASLVLVDAGGTATDDAVAAIDDHVHRHGGRLRRLANDRLVVLPAAAGVTGDHAGQASRCALALRKLLPSVPIAVITGAITASTADAMDRLIARGVEELCLASRNAGVLGFLGEYEGAIRLDSLTAHLLDDRFQLSRLASTFYLHPGHSHRPA